MSAEQRFGISPEELNVRADFIKRDKDRIGELVSPIVVYGEALSKLGRDTIKKLTDRRSSSVIYEISSYIRQMRGTPEEPVFIKAVGSVLVGRTVVSLENAIADWVWSNEDYVDSLNGAIIGTPLEPFKLAQLTRNLTQSRTPEQVAGLILQGAKQDKTFLVFFTSGKQLLPDIAYSLLFRGGPGVEQAVGDAVRLYQEALKL